MSYRITYDEDASGNMILRYSGDVQGLVDACAAEAREYREHYGRFGANKKDFRPTLSLDPVVAMEIMRQHGIEDPFDPRIFEIASGRDYSKFRRIDDKLMWQTRARNSGRIITLGVEKKDAARKVALA